MEEKSFVKNASDPKQVKSAGQREKFKREQELRDTAFVLSSEQGRRFVLRYIELTGVNKISFTGDVNWGLFNEGGRNIGLALMRDVNEADPMSMIKMMDEKKKSQEKEVEPETKETENA